jgi:hypothetical protein
MFDRFYSPLLVVFVEVVYELVTAFQSLERPFFGLNMPYREQTFCTVHTLRVTH